MKKSPASKIIKSLLDLIPIVLDPSTTKKSKVSKVKRKIKSKAKSKIKKTIKKKAKGII